MANFVGGFAGVSAIDVIPFEVGNHSVASLGDAIVAWTVNEVGNIRHSLIQETINEVMAQGHAQYLDPAVSIAKKTVVVLAGLAAATGVIAAGMKVLSLKSKQEARADRTLTAMPATIELCEDGTYIFHFGDSSDPLTITSNQISVIQKKKKPLSFETVRGDSWSKTLTQSVSWMSFGLSKAARTAYAIL